MNAKRYIFWIITSITMMIAIVACKNPFAPKLSSNNLLISNLGNQKTVEGVFQNFSYAYQYKDTLVYGKLLDDNFSFIYRDYNSGMDKSWGRQEEMYVANNMFRNIISAELIWNASSQQIGDSLLLDVSRSFSLKLEINPADIINVYGRAVFRLRRKSTEDDWKILSWRDESNY